MNKKNILNNKKRTFKFRISAETSGEPNGFFSKEELTVLNINETDFFFRKILLIFKQELLKSAKVQKNFQTCQDILRFKCRNESFDLNNLNISNYRKYINNLAKLKLILKNFNYFDFNGNLDSDFYEHTPELMIAKNLSDFLFDDQFRAQQILKNLEELKPTDYQTFKTIFYDLVVTLREVIEPVGITETKLSFLMINSVSLQFLRLKTLYIQAQKDQRFIWQSLSPKYGFFTLYIIDAEGELVECFDILLKQNQTLQVQIQKRIKTVLTDLTTEVQSYKDYYLKKKFKQSTNNLMLINLNALLDKLEWFEYQLDNNSDLLLCLPFLNSVDDLPQNSITSDYYYFNAFKSPLKLYFINRVWVEGCLFKLLVLHSIFDKENSSVGKEELVDSFLQTYVHFVLDVLFQMVENEKIKI